MRIMRIIHPIALVALLSSVVLSTGSRNENIAVDVSSVPNRRQLFLFGWFGGNDNSDNDRPKGILDWLSDLFFPRDDDDDDGTDASAEDTPSSPDRPTPIRDFLASLFPDLFGDDDSSNARPTPFRDFIARLLGQEDSDTPIRDWLEELFGRNNSTRSTPVKDWLGDLFNGTADTPLFDAIENLVKDVVVYTTLSCPTGGTVPPCAYNLQGDAGVFVCRSFWNPLTGVREAGRTMCVNPAFTINATDTCGCCEDICPHPCSCGCELGPMDGVVNSSPNGNGMGYRVLATASSEAERALGGELGAVEEDTEFCVDPDTAISLINQFEAFSCVSAC